MRRMQNGRVASLITLTVAIMIGLSFASVPLYKMFCAATGFGGTTQVAEKAPARAGERRLLVRFDGNIAPGLPWRFVPEVDRMDVRTGQTATVFYKVTNLAGRTISATAAYNVTPDAAGAFFNKISCFCFSEQTLGPGETAEWPVVFFLDPALEQDETMKAVDSVTLSYTFFASKTPAAANAGATAKPKS